MTPHFTHARAPRCLPSGLARGVVLALACGLASDASAQGLGDAPSELPGASAVFGETRGGEFELPLAPDALPVVLTGELTVDGTFILVPGSFCPESARCILGDGVGFAGNLLWRWPSGWVAGLGLGFNFLDANGVHEITTLVFTEFIVRHLFLRDFSLHPSVGASIGAITLADAFRPVTAGAEVEVQVGGELELTPYVAVNLALALRVFVLGDFRSQADDVHRGDPLGPNVATMIRLGLVLLPDARGHLAP